MAGFSSYKRSLLCVFCLVFGVVVGVMAATPLKAAVENKTYDIFNNFSERIGYLGPGNGGQGTLFLFNTKQGIEIQMGAYDSGSETGQSLFGMHDRKGDLRLLMRLHGNEDSPVIILKNKNGIDKMLIGLGGDAELPFIKYQNSKGEMVNLLKE